MIQEKYELWTDFDGTAVAGCDLRNLSKRLLRDMPGFGDFLRGVQSSQGGEDKPDARVEVAGILTMRPRILKRFTTREIKRHGLREHFSSESQLFHVGRERPKAEFLVARSENARIGMLEDGPHRLAHNILNILATQENMTKTAERSILLGVVKHHKSQAYIDEFLNSSRKNFGDSVLSEFDYEADEGLTSTGHRIKIGRATLEVVQLAKYSEVSGRCFGNMLLGNSAPEL